MFKKNNSAERELDHPNKFLKGDMITLKERSTLPAELQGVTLTVTDVSAYKYSHGLVTEFQLTSPDGSTFTAMCENDGGTEYFTISKHLTDDEVGRVFNLDEFSKVFDEDGGEFSLAANQTVDGLAGWIGRSYKPSVRFGTAYYYDSDQRGAEISEYEGDGSEALQIHEFSGSPDDFSLSVEVELSGETGVYLGYSFSLDLIAEMWPNG